MKFKATRSVRFDKPTVELLDRLVEHSGFRPSELIRRLIQAEAKRKFDVNNGTATANVQSRKS